MITREGPSGFVSLVGRPNVGKSTLLNAILREKVAVVSPKPQTTRDRILGVYTSDIGQIVFLDTPGIHKPVHRLNEYMVGVARRVLREVDVVALVIDGARGITDEDHMVIGQVFGLVQHKPVVGVVNKTDIMEANQAEQELERLKEQAPFVEVVGVSAVKGKGIQLLIDILFSFLPTGPFYYPSDMITDQGEKFLAAEIIREKVFLLAHQEIPYSTAVVVEHIEERENLLIVRAVVYVERGTQKGIIIGREGRMLKKIGKMAREELEKLFGMKVYLDLWVKVKEKWRKKEGALAELGYARPRGQ